MTFFTDSSSMFTYASLKQVLKGLAYLHGLKIVHRDLKSSNVLLKFHCSCSNPLMCTCSKKCDVQLADFDSAIQLTKDGLLPASNGHKSDSNQQTFAVVPVGTMGYRPPESSQLIISNSVDVLSPPVCTKSDMWSFSVLMLKMVSGRYGPATQREVSAWHIWCFSSLLLHHVCVYNSEHTVYTCTPHEHLVLQFLITASCVYSECTQCTVCGVETQQCPLGIVAYSQLSRFTTCTWFVLQPTCFTMPPSVCVSRDLPMFSLCPVYIVMVCAYLCM